MYISVEGSALLLCFVEVLKRTLFVECSFGWNLFYPLFLTSLVKRRTTGRACGSEYWRLMPPRGQLVKGWGTVHTIKTYTLWTRYLRTEPDATYLPLTSPSIMTESFFFMLFVFFFFFFSVGFPFCCLLKYIFWNLCFHQYCSLHIW